MTHLKFPNSQSEYNVDQLYLRQLADNTGLSQCEIGRRLGISPRTVRDFLSDKRRSNRVPYMFQYSLEMMVAMKEDGINVGD